MKRPVGFAEILDAAERLDDESQAELIEILSRRLAERRREGLAASVALARSEFTSGQCQVMTPAEVVREAFL